MKCKFTLILLFLAISISGFAQENIRFGIKAGGNLSGFHTGKSINTGNSGINFGGIAELKLNDLFSLQSEIIYNRKGGLVEVKDKSFSEFYSIETDLDYIDIPVQAKIYFLKNVSLDLGAQVGFLLNSKGEITNSQNNNGEEVEFTLTNTLDFGLNGGFTIKFTDSFFTQARYYYGLTKVFEMEPYKNSLVSLSLGYFFN